MTAHRSLAIAATAAPLGTQPVDFRLGMAGLVANGGSGGGPLGARPGVFYDGGGVVVSGTSATSPMTYSVRALAAAIQLLGTAISGLAFFANDGAVVVNTTAAPGSNSRIDVIWARQHALAADGGADADNILELGVTQGTAAASPTVPAIPTGAMALAQAVILSTTTATNTAVITQVHNWTAAAGGPIPIRTSTERGALTPYAGLVIYRIDTGNIEIYSGTAWELLKPSLTTNPTITWASTGTAPAVGNGSLVATFTDDGEWVDFDILLTIGTTSTAGTGTYTLTGLPFAPAGGSGERWLFQGEFFDSSAGNLYPMMGQVIGGTTVINLLSNAFPMGVFSAAAPVAPAVGDTYHVNGRYRR